MLHKTFSTYNFTAFTIGIHKMCQGSDSSTTIMITINIGIFITMKTIILNSPEEIVLQLYFELGLSKQPHGTVSKRKL